MLSFLSNIGNTDMRRGKAVPPWAGWPLWAHWKKVMDLCLCWMEWTRDEGLLKVFSIEKLFSGLIPPGEKNLKENMCSLWEVRFTLRKTWLYRKSTMPIVSLDLSDAKGLRSSSREEQMTAYISACFGLHSKLRKQKTCNTYLPPKRCPFSSFLPSCPQLPSWAVSSPVLPLTWVHSTTSPFPLGCRGVVCEQYQLKVRRYSPESALSVSCTGLWLQS